MDEHLYHKKRMYLSETNLATSWIFVSKILKLHRKNREIFWPNFMQTTIFCQNLNDTSNKLAITAPEWIYFGEWAITLV